MTASAAPSAAETEDQSALTALRLELEERDRRLQHLEGALQRKGDERDTLFRAYQELNEQVLVLQQFVAARLGKAPQPEADSSATTMAPEAAPAAAPEAAASAAAAPPVAAAPAPASGAIRPPEVLTRWLQGVEQEVNTGKARLNDTLARGKAQAQTSMQQLQEGWSKGVDELVSNVQDIAPALSSKRRAGVQDQGIPSKSSPDE